MLKKFIVFVFSVLWMIPFLTAEDPPQKTPEPSAWKFSFSERIRQESSDNVSSLDESRADSSSYLRMRTSLAADWKPSKDLEFYLRLTNESKYYLSPKSDPKLKVNYSLHEVVIDNLFAKWTRPAGLPISLTLGRQDLRMGEGFVIFDGGPGDGSRTAYFNGARADFHIDAANMLTAFYVKQPRTDEFLPRLNDVGQILVEQAEEGFGLYHSGGFGKTKIEAYFFRFNREPYSLSSGARFQTAGGRVQIPFAARLSLTAEGALQFGKQGAERKTGAGGYIHLDYATGATGALPAAFTLGGICLSGDDPATADKYEGWDPVFGRWPKWSESFIYLLAKETRVAYWSNFVSLFGGMNFILDPTVKLNLTWHHLGAAERTDPSSLWSGSRKNRGNLGILKLTYEISRHLQGHFVWEQFQPGNFYFSGAQSYAWIRFELLIKY
ncbi:MAG: hypothetical protein ACYDH3_05205 [Candidatus Aminicenantales bacterium]